MPGMGAFERRLWSSHPAFSHQRREHAIAAAIALGAPFPLRDATGSRLPEVKARCRCERQGVRNLRVAQSKHFRSPRSGRKRHVTRMVPASSP